MNLAITIVIEFICIVPFMSSFAFASSVDKDQTAENAYQICTKNVGWIIHSDACKTSNIQVSTCILQIMPISSFSA